MNLPFPEAGFFAELLSVGERDVDGLIWNRTETSRLSGARSNRLSYKPEVMFLKVK